MSKEIVLFDIDRTIFDTAGLTNFWVSSYAKIIDGATEEDIRMALDDFIGSLSADREFNPENFVEFVSARFNFKNPELLLDVVYGDDNKHLYRELIFPETHEILEKLGERYRVGIFSEGTLKYQNYKFKSMEISQYLDEDLVFILDHKTNPEVLSKIPEGAIVIDDKESVCRYLHDNGVRVIWLNKKDTTKSKDFDTIFDLKEVVDILL